jgi:hypothetical protein
MKYRIFLNIVILTIAAWVAGNIFVNWRNSGFENSSRGYLELYVIHQKSWKETYGLYAENRAALIGNAPTLSSEYQLFVSRDEIPKEYLSLLPENNLPFLSKGSFRLLLAVRHRYRSEIFFWLADSQGLVQKLSVRYELK